MELLLSPFAGCNRFFWNQSLALQKERLYNNSVVFPIEDCANLLPRWKKEHPFVADAPSQEPQQTLKDLSRAISEAKVMP